MSTAEQQTFDDAPQGAAKEQSHQRPETLRFALLASRTKGIVKNSEYLASLTDTNERMRKPTSPDAPKGLFSP